MSSTSTRSDRELVIPEGVMIDKRGACVPVAMLCLSQMYDDEYVIEGYIRFSKHSGWFEHTWMLLRDCRFDPTAVQFRKFKNYPAAHRQIKQVFSVPEYRLYALASMRDPFWRNRVQLFGISPEEICA